MNPKFAHLFSSLIALSFSYSAHAGTQNLQLYQEYPQPGEAEQFAEFGKLINRDVQEKTLGPNGQVNRAFHAKQHGCLQGTFNVLPSLSPELKYGVFANAPKGGYPVWIRFSNAFPKDQPDAKPDARGIAVKLMNVPGDKLIENERMEKTQDFLLTNKPRGTTADAKSFVEFAQMAAAGQILKFIWKYPEAGFYIVRAALKKVPSLLGETYWSGVPFKLGPRAVKYMIRPCTDLHKEMPKDPSYHYLKEDLIESAKNNATCFDFLVQFQTDPVKMPIEDALVRWDEKVSPFIPVAKINLPVQAFSSPEQDKFCTDLNFNPWHSLPAHQPIGNMNRARKYVYEASQKFRHSGVILPEPTPKN